MECPTPTLPITRLAASSWVETAQPDFQMDHYFATTSKIKVVVAKYVMDILEMGGKGIHRRLRTAFSLHSIGYVKGK